MKALVSEILSGLILLGCNNSWQDTIETITGRVVIDSVKNNINGECFAYFTFCTDDTLRFRTLSRCPETAMYIVNDCCIEIEIGEIFNTTFYYPCSKLGNVFEIDLPIGDECSYEAAPQCKCIPD